MDYYIGLHWIGSISKAIWNIQLGLSWTLDFGTKTKRAEIFKTLLAYLSVCLFIKVIGCKSLRFLLHSFILITLTHSLHRQLAYIQVSWWFDYLHIHHGGVLIHLFKTNKQTNKTSKMALEKSSIGFIGRCRCKIID